MRLTFHGAAQEVTGSMHLLEVNGQRVLLDCGLHQGRRRDSYARNLNFPWEAESIDCVVLSHAHIDHTGKLPNLVKQGFGGNVWCTAATRNLSAYMLMDSGYIQEKDVEYLNRKRSRRGEAPVEPIYTREDAKEALPLFVSVGEGRPVLIGNGVTLTFHNAGHILGSAFVELEIEEFASGKSWKLVFSGDLGRDEIALLRSPAVAAEADLLIMESTYGGRLHGQYETALRRLREVVCETARRGGKVIIPSFAVGRTQEIVYALNQLDARGDIPEIPVFVDSPLAINATDVFRMHPESWDTSVQTFMEDGRRRSPFDYPRIEYVREVRRSKQLNYLTEPAIIISASGMAESGRVLHHLKNNITRAENTVLIVSYQAQHTLGRRILEGNEKVRIFGEEYNVRAEVARINGYSAHADQAELLEWASHFDRERLQRIFLVHGEPEGAGALAEELRGQGHSNVVMPTLHQSFEF